MITKHSAYESPRPYPVGLRLAKVVSIGKGTVDVCYIGSSVVLHDIPVTSSSEMSVGDVINVQMMDNKRFAFSQENISIPASSSISQNITLSTIVSGSGTGSGTTYTSGTGIDISGNVISVDSNVVQTTRRIYTNTGSGLSGGGFLSSDLSLYINTSTALTWTALQQFASGMSAATGTFGVLTATGNSSLQDLTAKNTLINGTLGVTGNSTFADISGTSGLFTGLLSARLGLNVTGNSVLNAITGTTGVFTGFLSGQSGLSITGNSTLNEVTGTTGLFTGLLSGQSGLSITGNTVIQNATAANTIINGTLAVTGNSTLANVTGQAGTFTGLLSGQNNFFVTGNATIVSGGLNVNATGAVVGQVKASTGLFSNTVYAEDDITSNKGGFYGSSLNGKNSGSGAMLTLTSGSTNSIVLTPGDNKVSLTFGVGVQSFDYQSQIKGMRIAQDGSADFRYIFADELHAKSFITDLEQALAGGQIISKSVAVIAEDFPVPNAGASGTIILFDLPSAKNQMVFSPGDWIGLRNFTRTTNATGGQTLDISWAYGTVTGYATASSDSSGRTKQTWNFVRATGGYAGSASGITAYADSLALDFGTSGNGYHEVNALDGMGAINSPYSQVVTWADYPGNTTVRTRMGNIKGITATTGFDAGLYAGDGSPVNSSSSTYIRLSAGGTEFRNVPVGFYNSSGNRVISIVPSPTATAQGPYISVGVSNAPTGFLGAGQRGFWVGSDNTNAKVWLGNIDGNGNLENGFSWDGSTSVFTVKGVINIQSGGNAATVSYAQSASANAYTSATGYALTQSNSASSNAYTNATGYALTQSNSASANAYNTSTAFATGKIAEVIDVSDGSLTLNKTPGGSGLFLGAANIGFYTANNWTTYLASSGNFIFRQPFATGSALSAVRWIASSGILEGGYYASVATGTAYGTWVQQWTTDANNGMITAGGGRTTLGASGFSLYNTAADATANTVANLRIRFGELNGTYGYTGSTFGFAAGASATTYLTADAASGFRIINSGNQTFQVSTGGAMTIGRVAASYTNILIDAASGIQVRLNTTPVFRVSTDGDVLVGATGTTAANNWISIDNSVGLLIKNGSKGNIISMDLSGNANFAGTIGIATAGGIYQGTGTFANPTTGLKIWNLNGIGKIAGYASATEQWSATDGKLKAGSVTLDEDGISVSAGLTATDADKYKIFSVGGGSYVSQWYREDSTTLTSGETGGQRTVFSGNGTTSSAFGELLLYQSQNGKSYLNLYNSSSIGTGYRSSQIGIIANVNAYLTGGVTTPAYQARIDIFAGGVGGSALATGNYGYIISTSDDFALNGELGYTTSKSTFTQWVNASVSSPWSSFDGGSTFNVPAYKRFGDIVVLRGVAKRASGSSLTTVILTLPSTTVNYRPLKRLAFSCIGRISSSGASSAYRIDVTSTGTVEFVDADSTSAISYISLEGIIFSVA